MRYWYEAPHEKLTGYVRTVLVADRIAQDSPSKVPLVMAGMPAVIVQCRPTNGADGSDLNDDSYSVRLFGSPVPPDFKLSEQHDYTIAFFFKPFALACIFDLQAQDLAKGPIGAEAWNKVEAGKLIAQLERAQRPEQMVAVLNAFFNGLLARHHHVCELIRIATDKIMLDPARDILSELPDTMHTTLRTFQRMFRKYVGISPNEYRRICQFQQSFQQVRARQFDKLSDVAVDNGFSDQSHFVRSFREFAQTTPGKYMDEGLQQK